MNIIKINILKNKMVECEKNTVGVMGENGETTLKFTVPEEYKDYYKYLDIVKADGEKTQTVVDNEKKDVFYFTIPYFLTEGSEICIQLVMKLENKIFKSNHFSLAFNGSIDVTQILENSYQDTIEFIMENKADIKETALLNRKIETKAEKGELYSFKEEARSFLEGKVDKKEGMGLSEASFTNKEKGKLSKLPERSELDKALDAKVEKEEGKGLSSNDYTEFEKEKLMSLPENEELKSTFNEISKAITTDYDQLSSRIGSVETASKEYTDREIASKLADIPEDTKNLVGNVANSIEGERIGTEFLINDISPLNHTMKIELMGKNRINNIWESGFISTNNGENQPSSNYVRTKGFTLVSGGATYVLSSPHIKSEDAVVSFFFYDEDKTFVSRSAFRVGSALKAPNKAKFLRVACTALSVNDYRMQLEKGTTVTSFEEYIDLTGASVMVNETEYFSDVYGIIEVKSSYPEVNISTNVNNVEMTCRYNKDINKVIKEITNAIISLGGNI